MGLFDKIKGKVQQATQQPQSAPPPQQAYEEAEPVEETEDSSDADDWGGWDPNDWVTYWYRLKAIETAGNQGGDDAADAKCREFGLHDFRQMQRVRDTFTKYFGDRHEFVQAAMQANNVATREQLGNAAQANQAIFEPVEGVTLEMYAGVQARAATGGDFGQALAQIGCDQVKWERISAEWLRRMSGQAGDQNATMALLTEYGKFFGQAGQGQYGQAAQANAGRAGVLNDGSGAVGGPPCTLERYAEVGGAQSAWAQQGRDVNAMLQQQFGMNALDWSNISQYWSAQFMADYRIAARYGELSDYYTKQYLAQAAGGPDSDIDI